MIAVFDSIHCRAMMLKGGSGRLNSFIESQCEKEGRLYAGM